MTTERRAKENTDGIDLAIAAGRAAFVGIGTPDERLRLRLAAHGPASRDETMAAEVVLAAACAEGDAQAIAIFEKRYIIRLDQHLGRMRLTAAQVDEIRQRLRIRLLTGAAPGIATYSGRAPLDAWVRVAAMRVALRYLASERQPRDEGQALGALLAGAADADLVVDQGARAALRAALEQGIRKLEPRDRAIVRYFLDGLNIDAIGAIFRVHRATAARWLMRIRRELFESVRHQLMVQLEPSPSEFRSLVRLAQRDLDLSLARVLSDGAPGSER